MIFFCCLQIPEDHGEDDSSEKTPSKASKSPQKSTKRPKTIPVKVSLLDGSDYEAAVEVCSHGTGHSFGFFFRNFYVQVELLWQATVATGSIDSDCGLKGGSL